MSDFIHIADVGPRDGLQSLKQTVPLDTKVELVRRLIKAGLTEVEVGSFVSKSRVPQMADTGELLLRLHNELPQDGDTQLSALVPNLRGATEAIEHGATKLAVFASVTETFSQRNTGGSVKQVHARLKEVSDFVGNGRRPLRGYLSCVFDCPFEGAVTPEQLRDAIRRMHDLGVSEIDLGDTLGTAGPCEVEAVLEVATEVFDLANIVMHFHDTFGRGIACAWEAVRLGVRKFDASIGGAGGCPFAPGAAGNIATEDLQDMLDRCGFQTGLDLPALIEAAALLQPLGVGASRVGQALSKRASRKEEDDN